MRNPERIPAVLEELERVWKKAPDLRLAQLVSIAASLAGYTDDSDLFYVEDDQIVRGLGRINP